MASKKYILVMALIVLIQSVGLAQTDLGWDWKDTSKISVSNLPQHNEFLNNQYPYPAKPRNMWELGLSFGKAQVFGDVLNYGFGYGGALTLRKAIGHVVSLRGGILYQKMKGIDSKLWSTDKVDGYLSPTNGYRGFTGYGNYAAYTPNNPNQSLKAFTPNYRNVSWSGTFDVMFSLNALSHYRANPARVVYLFGCYAMVNTAGDTRLALGGNGSTPFNYTTVNFKGREDEIHKAVNNLISKTNTGGPKENYPTGPVRRKNKGIRQ